MKSSSHERMRQPFSRGLHLVCGIGIGYVTVQQRSF